MLAVALMPYGWQALLFAVAIVLLLLAAFGARFLASVNLVALGLAVFVFVFFYNALARA